MDQSLEQSSDGILMRMSAAILLCWWCGFVLTARLLVFDV